MPFFAMIGRDGPRGAELRMLHRQAHLDGIAVLDRDRRIRHAGPLIDENGAPCGSVIIFEASDLATAKAQAAGDPYVVEGIFERHEVFETKVIFPADREG
jgi:uncharacterized protein YciI